MRVTDPPTADDGTDAWFAFESETALTPLRGRNTLLHTAVKTRRRPKAIHVILAALGLVVVVQGALIALWLSSRASAARTGSVTFTSHPAAAAVTIDGVPRGATPLTFSLADGTYHIEVGTGAQTRAQAITVGQGRDASYHVELANAPSSGGRAAAPATGGLNISTEPPGARVAVDGVPHGTSPVVVPGLTPGSHLVVVTAATGTVNRQVSVEAGVTSSLIIAMTNSRFASGWLEMESAVPAQIFEGGALIGHTETPKLLLAAGPHTLDLVNTDLGYRVQRRVVITAGQTSAISLSAPQGTLSVNATPWAEVWIDGRNAGETPIANMPLPVGHHQLIFRHPELGEHRRTVAVGAEGPTRIGVDLRK